jgi:hypothetical protein
MLLLLHCGDLERAVRVCSVCERVQKKAKKKVKKVCFKDFRS